MTINSLSIIIPSYKQEETIVGDIKNLDKILSSFPYKYEILIVVDGFLDKTYKKVKKLETKHIKVFGYEKNQGKGFAVKYGMLKAEGDVIGFLDGGMEINPVSISILLDLMVFHNADIIIGSKLHPESEVRYPFYRKVLSWGYRNLAHILFGFNVRDTQVGLKFFKKKVAKDVFNLIIVKTFAFDVEVLAVANKLGYKKIFEGPIELDFKKNLSSITTRNFWVIIFMMLWDTAAVFYRLKFLKYYDRKQVNKVKSW